MSWDEAIATLERAAQRVLARCRAKLTASVSSADATAGFMLELLRRFSRSYGTPNFFDGLSRQHGALDSGSPAHAGRERGPDLRLDVDALRPESRSRASSSPPARWSTSHARRRATGEGQGSTRRTRIVQVEPSPSKTARQADEWISIAPRHSRRLRAGHRSRARAGRPVRRRLRHRSLLRFRGLDRPATVIARPGLPGGP